MFDISLYTLEFSSICRKFGCYVGQGSTKRAVPIHEIATIIDNTITDILPQVHALTGCDTTSKIGTKRSALQVASTPAAETSY